MMSRRKLKERIQTLEAQVRGLADENQQLQVTANEAKLRAKSLEKAIQMYESKLPVRNAKGQFIKKGVN